MTYQLWQADFDVQTQFPHHGAFLCKGRPLRICTPSAGLKNSSGTLHRKGHELASDEEKSEPKSHEQGPTTGPQQRVTQKYLLEAPRGRASHLSYQQLAKCLLNLGTLSAPPQQRRSGVLKRRPTIYSL